jgi:uncharacterized protein (TIGR03435 family)
MMLALRTFIVTLLLTASASAQVPQFDVATIKPYTLHDGNFMMRSSPGGRFNAVGVPLRMLMMWAYNLKAYQFLGAPPWTGTELWEVHARAEGVDRRLRSDEERVALRALLENRYRMKVHRETRELAVYALVVATKNGAKLRPPTGQQFRVRPSWGQMTAEKASMAMLANELSNIVWRPVLDKTELKGEYAFTLEWTPAQGEYGPEAVGLPPGDYPPGPERVPPDMIFKGPALFTALKEQLGLRLESQRGPAEVLVIDHVERPSEN